MRSDTVPVLVIGGGPVGLSVAVALRRWGVECRLLERHGSTLDFPKGRGVSTRTMEIFREWEMEDEITRVGLPRVETEHFYLGETLLAPEFKRFDRTDLGRSTPASPTERLICSQDRVERVLHDRAVTLGADLRFSTALVEITQDDDSVNAVIEDLRSGDRERTAASYVVAADGGRSTVRNLLGIGTTGPGPRGERVNILVEADLAARVADRLAIIYKVAHPEPSAFFAVVDNDRRWLLNIARDPASQPPEYFTDERCLELVREAIGDDEVPLSFLGRHLYQPTALVADRFQKSRVFLAGDAAHLATPFGALGMNCGIADAHNLAWKLAGVLQGWAAPGVLDSYDAERRPVGHVTSEASILRADVSKGPPRASFDGVTMGYAYDSAITCPDGIQAPTPADAIHDYVPTARPGHRAPHVLLERDGRRCSTIDLFGGAFALLVNGTSKDQLAAATAADVVPLRVHHIGPGEEYVDPAGEWPATYGLAAGGMVLIRPDGHVAWRTSESPPDPPTRVADALRAATGWA